MISTSQLCTSQVSALFYSLDIFSVFSLVRRINGLFMLSYLFFLNLSVDSLGVLAFK